MITAEEARQLMPIVLEAGRLTEGLPPEQRGPVLAEVTVRAVLAQPWGRAMLERVLQERSQNR